MASPSALPMSTGSTVSPSASGRARSRSSPLTRAAITASPRASVRDPGREPAGAAEGLPGRRARFHHVLAAGEGDLKLVGWHG